MVSGSNQPEGRAVRPRTRPRNIRRAAVKSVLLRSVTNSGKNAARLPDYENKRRAKDQAHALIQLSDLHLSIPETHRLRVTSLGLTCDHQHLL